MIECIREVQELDSLADSWNMLAEPFETPLRRYEWSAACARAFCPPGQLHVLVAREGKEITALAPLTILKRAGIETLELLGNSFLYEPGGFLYRDRESLWELVRALRMRSMPVLLWRLSADSEETEALRGCRDGRVLLTIRESTGAPYLPIETDWFGYEATISGHRRSSLRRALRRAEAFGRVEFEIASPRPEELPRHLEEVFHVEAAGWKGRNGTAMLSSEQMRRFFSFYAYKAARLGILRLGAMRIDGRPAAIQVAVEYANRFWVLKIGYDERWARCSPGVLLMRETLRYAFERGLASYEFLGSDQPWIHFWTDRVHPHVSSRMYPFSFRSGLRLGIDMTEMIVNRARAGR